MTPLEQLAAHPFFAGFDPALLAVLEPCVHERQFGKNEVLMRQNQEIRECHFVLHGRIMLETCDTRGVCMPIQTLEGGAVAGLSWLVPPYHSFFDARVLEPVTTLAVDCQCLRLAMDNNHDFGYKFLKRAVRSVMNRLQASRLQLAEVYAHPTEPRR
ncbi:MAG: Crp/Fnr family transcriptional regulator [Nevskia sp.]|nr:Crp/Fnr family transcriptional regulator [Nevskia sp.]